MYGRTPLQGPCLKTTTLKLGDKPARPGAAAGEPIADGSGWSRFEPGAHAVRAPDQGLRRRPLPRPRIDTGAGLERVTAVAMGRRSNYDTDLVLLAAASRRQRVRPHRRTDGDDDVGMRVLADHSRATANLIGMDGVLPSNPSRGCDSGISVTAIRFAVRLRLPAGFFAKLCHQ